MVREERVTIPCRGIRLEGLLSLGEALSVKGGMVLCHPHPLYGGDMHNRVIAVSCEAAREEGYATLRFNFRGVGGSEGNYDEGIGEKEDVASAIEFLHSALNRRDVPLSFLGYSFGAWVGLPVAMNDPRVRKVVAISPPLEIYDFSYFKGFKGEKLILAGDRDEWCPLSRLKQWYETLDEPKSLTILEGADHFYSFQSNLITQPLRDFLRMGTSRY
ncbi:MAG: alpha/beta hydrolase [Desulfobacterota bacterium]|nr:alpha/beta hydrolase [Thermodesulfobacteriota bacterium]